MNRLFNTITGLTVAFVVLCVAWSTAIISAEPTRKVAQAPKRAIPKESEPEQPPPPAASVHSSHDKPGEEGAVVELDIAKLVAKSMSHQVTTALEKQAEVMDKLINAIDRLSVQQASFARSQALDSVVTMTPKKMNEDEIIRNKYKYAAKSINGRWYYGDDIDEVNYAKWYHDRRARGIPIGQEPLDKPPRVNQPAVPEQQQIKYRGSRVRSAKNGMIISEQFVQEDGSTASPTTQVIITPQFTPQASPYGASAQSQVMAMPQASPYGNMPMAMSGGGCYSSSQQMSAMSGYQMPQSMNMSSAMSMGGGGYGYQPSMQDMSENRSLGVGGGLSMNKFSYGPSGLFARLFGREPSISSRSLSLGSGIFGAFGARRRGGASSFMECPGGNCPSF